MNLQCDWLLFVWPYEVWILTCSSVWIFCTDSEVWDMGPKIISRSILMEPQLEMTSRQLLDSGAIHMKTLFCVNMSCIVLADCPNGSCKTWSKGEKIVKTALVFSFGKPIRILWVSMTPSPHPSTSSLRPLNPTTSHNNNNNNSGGLHACVQAY